MGWRHRVIVAAIALLVAASTVHAIGGAAASRRSPEIWFTSPTSPGAVLGDPAVLRGKGRDPDGIRRVRVAIDGADLVVAGCRCSGSSVRWSFRVPDTTPPGAHRARVVALDRRGHRAVVSTTFTISGPAPTPTPTPSPTPTPTPTAGSPSPTQALPPSPAFRAFRDDSSWRNIPLASDAPIDPELGDVDLADPRRHRRCGSPADGPARQRSAPSATGPLPVHGSDPLYTIVPVSGPTVSVHIPAGATPSNALFPKMTVFDRSTDQVIGMTGAAFVDGAWSSNGLDRYWISSDGIAQEAGGTEGNLGHRGASMANKVIRLEEVNAGIDRPPGAVLPPADDHRRGARLADGGVRWRPRRRRSRRDRAQDPTFGGPDDTRADARCSRDRRGRSSHMDA